MRTNRLAPLALLLALGASVAAAQTLPVDLEVGYRFTDVTGNKDLYRTQVGDREGFLLRSLTWNGEGLPASALFDRIRVDASDLGAGPAGSFRLTAALAGAYRLDLSYRRTEHFSVEPGFANPLLAQGVVPGQHTMDRVRNVLDAELTLFPGGAISPFVGYSRNRYDGPGRTTYTVGADDFRLDQALSSHDEEFHLGADFAYGPVAGRVMQGWRQLRESETVTLVPGAGGGNNTGPVLGQNVTTSQIARTETSDSNTPVTTALLTITPVSRVKIVGSYVRADAGGDASSQEDLSGSLVSFALSRFFTGLSEGTSASARSKTWRGAARVEVSLFPDLDLTAGFSQRHRELSGYELITSIYLGTTTFAGLDRKDILQTLQANTSLDRTDKLIETRLTARALGPLSAYVGWSQEKQDLTVDQDPAEIVVPGSQEGSFSRTVKRFDAGLGFRMAGVFAAADWQRARADDAVTRVDFLSRDRYRAKLGYAFRELARLSLSAEQVDTKNDATGLDRSGRLRQYGGELSVTPHKNLRFHVSGFKYKNDDSMTIRQPQNFGTIPSVYAEDGRSFEVGAGWNLAPVSVEGSFSRFQNHGDVPFRITRVRVLGDLSFTSRVGLITEWSRDEYEETGATSLGDYDGNRYGLYVRIRP